MKLSSILKEYGISEAETKLVRHAYNKPDVKEIYDKGFNRSIPMRTREPCF